MSTIAIITATYNHPEELRRLYKSLERQTSNDFRWIIINDGSDDQTEEVVKDICRNSILEVVYQFQNNGGKSRAINRGLDCLKEELFVLFVDDDEILNPNAIEIVKEYAKKYQNKGCVAIDFNHYELNSKKRLANYDQKDDYFMSVQERKAKGISSDGYTGYFVDAIKSFRFPVYKMEKYVGPSVLMMLVSRKGKILWSREVLGGTSYLENGITKSGRMLRVKNPCGMISYCVLLQENGSNMRIKILYSILGYAYVYLAKYLHHDLDAVKYKALNRFFKLPGYLIGIYWRKKYLRQDFYRGN